MKDYPLLFKGQPDAAAATEFSRKVIDFSVYLARLGLRDTAGFANKRRVVYQDACHLLHAQGHQSEPRALLNQLPNLELVSIADAGMCCGSAGAYNIDQPEIAAELGRRKVASILAEQPDMVVSANIGCIMQMRQELARQEQQLPVMHIAQVLNQAALI